MHLVPRAASHPSPQAVPVERDSVPARSGQPVAKRFGRVLGMPGFSRSALRRRVLAIPPDPNDKRVRPEGTGGTPAVPGLAVTCRAVHEAFDDVLLDELTAYLLLIGRWLPAHVEDLFARPHVLRRISVTVEAPAHLH
jgi:hypothetical protein